MGDMADAVVYNCHMVVCLMIMTFILRKQNWTVAFWPCCCIPKQQALCGDGRDDDANDGLITM